MLITTYYGVKRTFLNVFFLPIYIIFNELSSVRLILFTSQDIKLCIYFSSQKHKMETLLHVRSNS